MPYCRFYHVTSLIWFQTLAKHHPPSWPCHMGSKCIQHFSFGACIIMFCHQWFLGFSVNCCVCCGLGCQDDRLRLFVYSHVLITAPCPVSLWRMTSHLFAEGRGERRSHKRQRNRRQQQTMGVKTAPTR